MCIIQIKNRWCGSVIFKAELSKDEEILSLAIKLGIAVRKAVSSNTNLSNADLRNADLSNFDLSNVKLRSANLRNVNLTNANLSNSDLGNTNLTNANLRKVNLRKADLTNANLTNTNLTNANLANVNLAFVDLRNVNLREVNLRTVDLSNCCLTSFRDDVWSILSGSPAEAEGVLHAIQNGQVDGSTYEGDCCCLVGTIAKHKGVHHDNLENISPSPYRLAESWFSNISKGDTPESNFFSKKAEEWVHLWISNVKLTFK